MKPNAGKRDSVQAVNKGKMRIHRLEIGIAVGPMIWGCFSATCSCKMLDLGPIFVTWLGYECMSYIYAQKARENRVKRYLKERSKRST